MIAAILIAALLGGGVSFAAEQATPGDVLYPVKVNVNEEVRAALSFSSEAKANWEVRRMERRLEEFEQLSAEGEINAKTRAELEERFEARVEKVKDRITALRVATQIGATLEVSSNLEARLKAHEHALVKISAERENVRAHVQPVIAKVRTRIEEAIAIRVNAEGEISTGDNERFPKEAAEGKMGAAENRIAVAERFIADADVNADAKARAEARLNEAKQAIAAGTAHIEAEAYGKAFVSFQMALRLAQQAQITVQTEQAATSAYLKLGDIKGESMDDGTDDDTDDVRTEANVRSEVKTDGTKTEVEGGVRVNIGL